MRFKTFKLVRYIRIPFTDSCSNGWTLIGKTCYFVSDDKVDFSTAKDSCTDKDAKLVEPKSLEENEKISALVKQKHGNDVRYFIGLTDMIEETK